MGLLERTKHLKEYIEKNKRYINRNVELFDIFEGNLRPYVDKILKGSLSNQYYSKITERIYPINILIRIIDKLARSYSKAPTRTATSSQEVLEFYENAMMFNQKMNMADEFAHLFKGYALEPFLKNGVPSLRVLPFDRFLVESSSLIDPTIMTTFYKHIGKIDKKGKEVDVWFVYTDEEFLAIDEDGDIVHEFMVDQFGNDLSGENPLGFIPFYYGNRSEYKILPTQDTDTLALAKLLPVQLSDLAGTILFQCFSIVYGIDVDSENMVMSPNAFWAMKSDPQSDKTPQVGTIKPSADITKVLDFIREVFSTWMESRGIRVGAMGTTDGTMNTSGISKIIDEMDTFEAINKQIEYFKKDETEFWELQRRIHNYWVTTGQLTGLNVLPENWVVDVEFEGPTPVTSRSETVDIVVKERDSGIISRRTAMQKLYPDWTDEDIEKEIKMIDGELI